MLSYKIEIKLYTYVKLKKLSKYINRNYKSVLIWYYKISSD